MKRRIVNLRKLRVQASDAKNLKNFKNRSKILSVTILVILWSRFFFFFLKKSSLVMSFLIERAACTFQQSTINFAVFPTSWHSVWGSVFVWTTRSQLYDYNSSMKFFIKRPGDSLMPRARSGPGGGRFILYPAIQTRGSEFGHSFNRTRKANLIWS